MPTVRRLKTRPQFLKVAAARRKWVTPGLVLQAARRQHGESRAAPLSVTAPPEGGSPEASQEAIQEVPEVRVGFTVTKKVGNAVVRNRVKRRLRAAAEDVFPRLGQAGTDYVVIGRLGALKRPYPALLQDLEQAVQRVDRHKVARPSGASRGRPSQAP